MENFKSHWISGMPRSGSTWLSQLFFSSPEVRLKFCPLFSYEFKNQLDETASGAQWQAFLNQVYLTDSEFLDQDYLRKDGLIPTFNERSDKPANLVIKSTRFHHLLPYLIQQHLSIKIIHIVRHPCASIYSWLSNPFEFPKNAYARDQWRTGECRKNGVGEYWGFEDWKKVNLQAISLENKFPQRFKIVQYEELAGNPERIIKEIFAFCGIKFTQQTKEFIYSSQNKHDSSKRSVYKTSSQIESWMGHLEPEIAAAIIKETTGTNLEKFLVAKSEM